MALVRSPEGGAAQASPAATAFADDAGAGSRAAEASAWGVG